MSHVRHEIGTWGRIYIIDNWTGYVRSCAPMHTPWSRDRRTHQWLVAILAAVFIGTITFQAADTPPGRWLVVAAPAFRAELTPLIEHRRAEGFQVTVLESTALLTPEQIQQTNAAPLQSHIRDFAMQTNSPCYVLLVGLPASPDLATAESNVVPAMFGTVERMKCQLTDYLFAPPPEPGLPMVAVGRFAARTADEIRQMVRKTIQLETQPAPGNWVKNLVVLVGNPGGGPMAEMITDAMLIQRLQRLHSSWKVRAISCSEKSRYSVPGETTREAFLEALEEGGLFSVFMGHSTASSLWLTGNHHFTRSDWTRLRMPMPGVFFTCGCYALQFQGNHLDGYGIAAIRQTNGPAAVIGATAESYAAPGMLAADGLLKCLREPPFPSRLADYWLAIQAGLARGEIDDFTFRLYDQADGTKGQVPLETQRLEHLEMWMLLGDPALRIPSPTLSTEGATSR
jgi:hypothetical protein